MCVIEIYLLYIYMYGSYMYMHIINVWFISSDNPVTPSPHHSSHLSSLSLLLSLTLPPPLCPLFSLCFQDPHSETNMLSSATSVTQWQTLTASLDPAIRTSDHPIATRGRVMHDGKVRTIISRVSAFHLVLSCLKHYQQISMACVSKLTAASILFHVFQASFVFRLVPCFFFRLMPCFSTQCAQGGEPVGNIVLRLHALVHVQLHVYTYICRFVALSEVMDSECTLPCYIQDTFAKASGGHCMYPITVHV